MGIDIPQSDNSAFDDTAMERVQAIEYLPFSQAFEHIMYDNRIVRHAEHSMTKPIYLLPELIETPARFPQEIAQYFPSSNCIIEKLHTSISDSLDEPRRDLLRHEEFRVDPCHRIRQPGEVQIRGDDAVPHREHGLHQSQRARG